MTPIERIKALLAEATPAPWCAPDGDGSGTIITGDGDWLMSDSNVLVTNQADFDITAALRNAAPALIEFVELSVAMESMDWDDEHYSTAHRLWAAALARLTKDEEA